MVRSPSITRLVLSVLLTSASLVSSGCRTAHQGATANGGIPPYNNMPRELAKTTLPTYVIEPPDILLIDAVRIVPRAPFKVNTMDVLQIVVGGTLPEAPIAGPFTVEPGGIINLGSPYGTIQAGGLTIDELTEKIKQHLLTFLSEPEVSITLAQLAGNQGIGGEHLVAPDGTVNLGVYGSVYVAGLSIDEAKAMIESHLTQFLEDPKVSVSVFAYNSKQYYVITQGAGLGDGVRSFPVTGNETVLDAISQINGLTSVSSKKIWVARPTPGGAPQRLLVNWNDITANGVAATNYQILPGDRIFVQQDRLVAFDSTIGKITAPFERVFGFTQLGTSTVRTLKFFNRQGGSGGAVFFP